MKMLVGICIGISALSLALSIWTVHELRTIKPIVAPSLMRGVWTPADEAAVLTLVKLKPQQLAGYLMSLRRGTQRHQWTESQLQEAIRRQEFERRQRTEDQAR